MYLFSFKTACGISCGTELSLSLRASRKTCRGRLKSLFSKASGRQPKIYACGSVGRTAGAEKQRITKTAGHTGEKGQKPPAKKPGASDKEGVL